jgi:Bacteriophage Mu-like, Gp48
MLNDLPPYLADDPWVRSIMDASARELKRVADMIATVRARLMPHNAGEQALQLWESVLSLPINPPGVSFDDRRNKVLGALRTRSAVEGFEWIKTVTQILGTADWEHVEGPGPYAVSVAIPSNIAYTIGTFETLLRRVTPAHLQISVTTASRFIIGGGIQDPTASLIQTEGDVL